MVLSSCSSSGYRPIITSNSRLSCHRINSANPSSAQPELSVGVENVAHERMHMDIQSIVAQLRQEATRIERAIAALTGLDSQPARRGRPPKRSQAKPASVKKRHRMSAAARARIGDPATWQM